MATNDEALQLLIVIGYRSIRRSLPARGTAKMSEQAKSN